MLAIESERWLRRMPFAMVFGLALMAVGGALDTIAHIGSVHEHAHGGFGLEQVAHLVGIAGMVLVLAGVVTRGARRQRRTRAARSGGFDRNAHR